MRLRRGVIPWICSGRKYFQRLWGNLGEHTSVAGGFDGGAYAPAEPELLESKAVDRLKLELELLGVFGGSTTAEDNVIL